MDTKGLGEPLGADDPERIGPYQVLGRLGAGGMGRVYLARSRSGLLVAVKTIRDALVEDPGFRERFAREVAAARQVSGVFTAAVVEADPDARFPWLATAYVPAPSLDVLVRAAGPLPPATVRWIGASIAEALEAIHAAGLVHRDLKPSNVLVSRDNPKVIDFGIARALGGTRNLTQSNVIGTPSFMSPEQAVDTAAVTQAADVYSLGATMLYAATGHEPYGGHTPINVLAQLLTAPPDFEGLPAELAPFVAACMERDPDRRPTTGMLLEDFARFRAAEMPHAHGAEDWLPTAAFAVVADHERRGRPATGEWPGPRTEKLTVPRTPVETPVQGGIPGGSTTPDAVPTVVVPPGGHAPTVPAAVPHDLPAERPPAPSRRRVLWAGAGVAVAAAGGVAAWAATRDGNKKHGKDAGSAGNAEPAPRPWVFATGDKVYSSPTVSGDIAYVGSNDGKLYALGLADGKPRWTYSAGQPITSSPAVGGDMVFFGGNDGRLHAVHAVDGSFAWQFPTGDIVHSSPRYADGVVYVGSRDKGLYAVDAASGTMRWRFAGGDWFNSSPAVAGSVVVIACRDRNVYAVAAATGTKLWAYQTGSTADSSPRIVGGRVYVGGDDRYLYALSAADGSPSWRRETGGGVVSSPAVADGVVYVGSDDAKLYAVEADTGRDAWQFPTGAGIRSSPAVVGNLVYVGSSDRKLYAVNRVTGTAAWTYETQGSIDDSSPAVANGLVVVGSLDHRVYAVTAASGAGPQLT